METQLGELIVQVQNLAPQVWAVAVRQAMIDAYTRLIWSGVLFAVTIVCAVAFWRMYKKSNVFGGFVDLDGESMRILIVEHFKEYEHEYYKLVNVLRDLKKELQGYYTALSVVMAIVGVGALIWFCCEVTSGVRILANPEWRAISIILSQLRPQM